MSVLLDANAFRKATLGLGPVSKSTGTLAATTIALFTVAVGQVMVTAMWGVVTTSITVANSYKLQLNPTTGDTQDLCAATDIGTSDTLAGDILQFGLATTTAPPKLISVGYGTAMLNSVLTIGQIESVSAGTDGVITWYACWVPLVDGATLVAA
jgi:hypothetical protein